MFNRAATFILILFVQACATNHFVQQVPAGMANRITAQARALSSDQLYSGLHRQYAEWQGTQYQLVGLSRKGVDCSGFVYLTFQKQFGINLPRTTAGQASLGSKISRKKLQVGDLVFFKTGKRFYHVGIYMEGHRFLHASSSKGVVVSSLDNPYWQNSYWLSRRL